MAEPTINDAFVQAYRLHASGQLADAEARYRQILAQQPDHADALHLLGMIAYQVGQPAAAAQLMRQSVAHAPEVADTHNNLALALEQLGHVAEARAACETALRLRPAYPEAQNTLGNILVRLGDTDAAIAAYDAALRLKPDYAEALCNRGIAHKDAGRLDAAIADFRAALRLRPQFAKAHSHLIFTLHYHENSTPTSLRTELQAWRRQHADPLRAEIQPLVRDLTPDRRLRVGYVSPDLRGHAVGRFLLPSLREHERTQFEVACYSDVSVPDEFTTQLKSHAAIWRDTVALNDAALAARIREDQVDILVDLTLHTGKNRLLVFARKPAPVQVTYLAYCGSSGLDTMDYRLTDPHFDPPAADASGYSERSVRLPETYWCYEPIAGSPEVNPLPARTSGAVTFGCLNNFCKITAATIRAWSRILKAVPASRLVALAPEGRHREDFRNRLADGGVERGRISFVGHLPPPEYARAYQQIDLGLDPFPYGGGTTTCDSLWMGVPVVTLTGAVAISRAGSSILRNLGLDDWITSTETAYVDRAIRAAAEIDSLSQLRETLRARMTASPLMNAPRFTRNLEAAYRAVWREAGGRKA